jgi:hypothetical protein
MKKTIFMAVLLAFAVSAAVFAQTGEQPSSTPNGPEDFDIAQNAEGGGGITITNYKGTRKHVVIPDRLYGLPVTIIGRGDFGAFYNKGLISVVIPNTVVIIDRGAFTSNELVRVTLGNSLRSIGFEAFAGNPLTEITIPNSVVEIGIRAFQDCRLSRITFGSSLQRIGEYAFSDNRLESVIIPNGVTFIGVQAFLGNPITRITMPANLNFRDSLGGLDVNLINYYVGQGSRAGTYVKNGPVWVRQ